MESIDFLARLADVWDSRGDFTLRVAGIEHRALLQIAQLPINLAPGDVTTVTPGATSPVLNARR